VDDRVDAAQPVGEAVDAGNVALEDVQPLLGGQQAPGALSGAGQGEDLGSGGEQLGGNVAASSPEDRRAPAAG
jgi:hypothetical protein